MPRGMLPDGCSVLPSKRATCGEVSRPSGEVEARRDNHARAEDDPSRLVRRPGPPRRRTSRAPSPGALGRGRKSRAARRKRGGGPRTRTGHGRSDAADPRLPGREQRPTATSLLGIGAQPELQSQPNKRDKRTGGTISRIEMRAGAIVGQAVTRRSCLEADLRFGPRGGAPGSRPQTASTSPFGASCHRTALFPSHVATSNRGVMPVEGASRADPVGFQESRSSGVGLDPSGPPGPAAGTRRRRERARGAADSPGWTRC